MMACPPFCGKALLLMHTVRGSNELAAAVALAALLLIAGFALYRKLHPAT